MELTLKEKVKRKMKICGTHVSMIDPCICDMIGSLKGYDFIWVDMEHSYVSFQNLLTHLSAAHSVGASVIVRVPQHDLTYVKKVTEMGIDGIIFPMVKDASEAEELIKYTLYPPYGNRGFGPMGAIKYGIEDANEFSRRGHIDKMCRFIQIENKTAVDEIEKITKIEYLDGCIFGPNDLSGSINELGNVFGENNIKLIKKAVAVLNDSDKITGLSTYSTDEKVLKFWDNLGIQMISSGSDYEAVWKTALTTLNTLKKVHNKEG
jgi:2-dehydro-3-deoxyglucarate aldolase/4-hydroxy-2-oxoheptanedioate aldolase